MKKIRCLYCYQELSNKEIELTSEQVEYHSSCSKKMFGKSIPPEIPFSDDDILRLAEQTIMSQKTVTGVQPKLSLGIHKISGREVPDHLTIVGLLGDYILKPQTKSYKNLPENEDLTMHLAEISKIKTVKHSLIYLKSGELAYITKRVDRVDNKKLHMEDMCQLTERLTEHKYKGSYEQIAKAIIKFSSNPGLDVVNYYEQVIFSFLTGNSDMHLKNFSLLKDANLNYTLCPAYDLVASELVLEDDEELALNLNGKKKKIKRIDFETAMKGVGIETKVIENVFDKFSFVLPKWHDLIKISFLPNNMKLAYHEMVNRKVKQLEI